MARGKIVKSRVKKTSTKSFEQAYKKLQRDLKKEATKASRALVRENKVTKKRATGKYYSNITKKEYDSYEKAHAAGEIYKKKIGSGRYILPTKSALYNQYLEDALEKRALEKTRREERKAAKALQQAEEYDYDYSNIADDDEYEDVTEEVMAEQEQVGRYDGDLWIYWEDVSHGVIGNPWYYEHGSGSWLYVHGYDSWNLQNLLDDPYTVSSDGHTNIDFIKQALKDSQYNGIYELREVDGEYYIAKV